MRDVAELSLVVDASVTACWALDDEPHPAADAALARATADEVLVPSLWWFEIRNLLVVAERRNRTTVDKTTTFFRELRKLKFVIDGQADEVALFHLARTHRLTIYDAAYLELALREALPLATLDRALATAAKANGAALVA